MNLFLQYVGLWFLINVAVGIILSFFLTKRRQRDRAEGDRAREGGRIRQPFRGYSPEC